MASILDPQSGHRANTQQASNPPYNFNLDATSTPNRRPNQQPPRIWTPRQPPTGVQSALHPQSGRRPNHRLASNPPYISNLDAAPTSNRRPNQQPPRIWTPRKPPTGVQSAIHLQSGRRANRPLASNPPYTPNLDAAQTAHWRPISHTSPIWTPCRHQTGVQSAIQPQSGRHADTQRASKSATAKNLDAAPARKWRPFRHTTPIQPQSGRHANTQRASKSATTKNLDATIIHDGRPNHSINAIWTPRQPPTGVHSAIQPKSGRRPNHSLASISPYNPNLDAAPTHNRRPIRHTTQIWTPRQHTTGVQSAIHLQSGRRANTQQASNPPYISNLDAAPTTHWRPIRHTSPIWTPRRHPTGVQSAIQPQSGRRASP